jgi:RHH-type proline utilization regulon transcriptional repressor/proline dehydrogenase/delta 1-pyrroline-5-carboxylate dehydrogenase
VSEVREAVDFLRYYAARGRAHHGSRMAMPGMEGPVLGITGESNELRLTGARPVGVHQPVEFSAGDLLGQVAAALATGNTVLAKPAEQTPGWHWKRSNCCTPRGARRRFATAARPGRDRGRALVAAPGVAGVVFTGSTQVAKIINRALAAKDGPIVPLIAETGGINAMLVDSTALPEQVSDAVVQSAFRSAGQRCSALRLLCVHAEIADAVIAMIAGAAQRTALRRPGRPGHRCRPGDRPRGL